VAVAPDLASQRTIPPRERLIVALDVPSAREARALVTRIGDAVGFYKLGLELLMSGDYFPLVDELAGAGKQLFLDLKLHDIPETMARALRNLRERRVRFVTVHFDPRGLEAACREKGGLGILAVTLLTHVDSGELASYGYAPGTSAGELVLLRARQALALGCEGVIASPLEARLIRAELGDALAIVTPGIRPAVPPGARTLDDQRRIATPRAALEAGADYLVVGRPIHTAADPRGAALAIQETIAEVCAAPR
jgi:orotidine-5'-phosphate decarboxylase